MTDEYRISDPSTGPRPQGTGGALRPVLWLLLIISLAANAVTSTMGLSLLLSSAFGLVALTSGAVLVRRHYRNRRGH